MCWDYLVVLGLGDLVEPQDRHLLGAEEEAAVGARRVCFAGLGARPEIKGRGTQV